MDNVHHKHVYKGKFLTFQNKLIFDWDYLVADEILILGSYDIDLKSSTP